MATNDISYEFLQQLTATVLKFNVVITKLDAVSTSVDNNDVFTVASKVNSQFVSKNVTYKKFLDTTQEQIRKTPTANIVGKWTFGNKKDQNTGDITNLLLLDTNAIRHAAASNDLCCLVNLEYFKESSLKAIYDLSNYIYKDPHVPSHVGEIVYSYNLATADDMKRIYGDFTVWERIGDKYILGYGNPEENTIEKYGVIKNRAFDNVPSGEMFVELNSNNGFPAHTHPFKAEPAHFKFRWRFGTGMDEHAHEAGHTWLKAEGIIKQRHASKYYCVGGHHQCKKAGAAIAGSTISGECTISSGGDHGLARNVTVSNEIYTESGTRINSTAKHNNMPPSIILYCWRRIH